MVHKSRLNFGRVNLWKLLKLWSLKFGGAGGVRTRGLLDAIEARSQLRHGPTDTGASFYTTQRTIASNQGGSSLRQIAPCDEEIYSGCLNQV